MLIVDNVSLIAGLTMTESSYRIYDKNQNLLESKAGALGLTQVKPETVGRCSGMFDRNHTMIYEDDLIAHGKLVYRICRKPHTDSLGKLLLFDLVRHSDNATALKLHKPLIPLDKLPDHIEDFDRDFIRNSELVGDLYTFKDRMQTIDVSKVKGDKDAFIDKMITEIANGE